jgi:spore maturation protein CgeB
MMGSVVLKIDSPFEQWYHRNLKPWRHYIPVSRDAKDLRELHKWLLTHDREAQTIAREGRELIARVNLESALDGLVMIIENILAAREG